MLLVNLHELLPCSRASVDAALLALALLVWMSVFVFSHYIVLSYITQTSHEYIHTVLSLPIAMSHDSLCLVFSLLTS